MNNDTKHTDLVTEVANRVVEMLDARQAAAAQAEQELSTEFNTALSGVYARYPFLDSGSPKANQTALAEAVSLTHSLIAEGTANTEALLIAAARVGPKYDTAALH